MPKHAKFSPNIVAAPFPTDEKGRLKKTQVMDHIIKMKRDVNRKNQSLQEEKKKQNEETFVNYLLEKKQQEKEEKRKMRLMQQSGASIQAAPRTIEEAIEEAQSKMSGPRSAVDETSSSSSEEMLNTEGLLAVKDIEKLTGGNLDVKPLNIDLNTMRKFVHTPKEGIRAPFDTDKVVAKLEIWAQQSPISPWALVDEPKNRKTTAVFNAYEAKRKEQSPPKLDKQVTGRSSNSPTKRKTLNLGQKRKNP